MPTGPEGVNYRALGGIASVVSYRLYQQVGRARGSQQERQDLPSDLLEGEEVFVAVFDAPGTRASDVQVRFVDSAIRVRVERAREYREDFQLRFPGRGTSLEGEVALPPEASIDPEEGMATVTDDGTLKIRIPKAQCDPAEPVGATEEPVTLDDD
ncbi:MAG: Hsp20/alpha crystallin family protein [Natrialbaceae archaeon]|nr:Hsp20/alpha crystallin family protein [Natrialbaceae archaeon]